MSVSSRILRLNRHRRVRARVYGTAVCPRASVYRSRRSITVQLIDDEKGHTILSVAGEPKPGLTKTEQAVRVGKDVAKAAQAQGVTAIVFDRGGWAYRGRIAALARAMREGGLKF